MLAHLHAAPRALAPVVHIAPRVVVLRLPRVAEAAIAVLVLEAWGAKGGGIGDVGPGTRGAAAAALRHSRGEGSSRAQRVAPSRQVGFQSGGWPLTGAAVGQGAFEHAGMPEQAQSFLLRRGRRTLAGWRSETVVVLRVTTRKWVSVAALLLWVTRTSPSSWLTERYLPVCVFLMAMTVPSPT